MIHLDTCVSTQDEVRARAAAGHGLLVVADRQSAGRGRRGRTWIAEAGGLFLSALVRDQPSIGRLPLVGAHALFEAARALGAENVRFKWPNDLVVPHPVPGPLGPLRKVAGVLVELETGASTYAIFGAGVNLGGAALALPDHAASLPLTRDALLAAFTERFWPAVANLDDSAAFGRVLADLRTFSTTLGAEVEIDGTRGVARDLDDDGVLCVETEDGERRFYAGDVVVR